MGIFEFWSFFRDFRVFAGNFLTRVHLFSSVVHFSFRVFPGISRAIFLTAFISGSIFLFSEIP